MSDVNPAREAWNAAAELLHTENLLSSPQMAFIRMAHPLAAVDDIFMIAVGSEFIKDWIEENVAGIMTKRLSDIQGKHVRLVISVDPSLVDSPPSSDPKPIPDNTYIQHEATDTFQSPNNQMALPADPAPSTPITHRFVDNNTAPYRPTDQNPLLTEVVPSSPISERMPPKNQDSFNLNSRYTFDNFVIGVSNRFAAATSLAAAEQPGTTYNPLFIYSDSGMGKTHLLHAIGNYARVLDNKIKVRYMSAEEFTNAFINALDPKNRDRIAKFKDEVRNVDILLIDDIQFIGSMEQTVEEFFHTFNALTNSNRQIVITSDVAPNLLNGFEERMKSRFGSGVTVNIEKPNLETRIAILQKKAAADKIMVPREVHEYIATHMTTNVREMEGALRRVTAYADLNGQPANLTLAEMVLKDLISDPDSRIITASLVMAQTANYFQVTLDDLTSPDRSRMLVTARQIAMYLCREMTDLSLPKIGDIFGKRDHTTVMHACRKINKQMAERQTTYNQVSELSSRIKQAAQQS